MEDSDLNVSFFEVFAFIISPLDFIGKEIQV